MRLTTLEIKGFKSFADKTVIHINQDITGVVGPNGSGKSNVVDAIRWVLGEQRTSLLRSERMDNLIFNGSKTRKPAQLAEVSLTFDNTKGILSSEYTTITITRQLHRSGESEYRLNNVVCRLKDIINLFHDTGITSDSYAIIELSMVDEILNDRDNSRRKLFEQAAGISKYKIRKKETLNKLTATEADLARVEDLLFEIGNNLKTLEAQARKAERYNKLKEEYKQLAIELTKYQSRQIITSFRQVQAQSDEQEKTIKSIEQKIQTMESELEKQKNELFEKEKYLSDRQKRLNELISVLTKKENEKNIAQQQVKFLQEKKENILTQKINATQQLEKLLANLNTLLCQINQQQEVVNASRNEVELLNNSVTGFQGKHDNLKKEVEALLAERADTDRKIFELEKKITVCVSQKENLLKTIEQYELEDQQREAKLSELNNEHQTCEESVRKLSAQLDELNNQDAQWHQHLESLQADIEQLKQQLATENRILDAKTNKYNLNKSLIDNLEGYPESIRFLKKNAPTQKTKDAPLLTDILYCREEYRIAIENYLEPYLNYFVLDDVNEAYELIVMLSNSSKGRASFFVLPDFTISNFSSDIIHPQAIPAISLVETEEIYKQLVAYLLHNVYLVPDELFPHLENKLNNKDIVLLSNSGKYSRTRYSISGGAVGLFEGMRLGRKKNLELLQKEIDELTARKKQTEKTISHKQTELNLWRSKSLRELIQNTLQAYNAAQNKLISLTATIENLRIYKEENKKKSHEAIQKIQYLEREIDMAGESLQKLIDERKSLEEKYLHARQTFQEAAEQLNVSVAQYNSRNIDFYQQQNLLNQLLHEESYIKNQIDEINQRILQEESELELIAHKMAELEQTIQQLDQDIKFLTNEREHSEQSMSAAEKTYYQARAVIQDKEEQLKQEYRLKQQANFLYNELKDKNTELKIQLSSLKERLSVEFNISLNDIIDQELTTDIPEDELQQKVLQIKERLARMGEINPMAIDAYNEIKERHDFIMAQRNDLIDAKNSLMATMDEIETNAKERFLDAFVKIRENFIKVFRTLFTEEDNCDLRLQDPSNPLESKIEIIAQPKGKRPQVIDQLSGGEKTLTALALLFALYLLKPAPFCILDEVDAPLDDANISKFNKLIREFSSQSQFILITHNKSTMTAVDVIYGVTMQEMGVSKVVPVDFRDLN